MEIRRWLQRVQVFAGIDPRLLDRFASAASTRMLERGQYLWRAGDPPRHLTVLRSGLVKIVRPSAGGRSTICGLFAAPDTVGDLALIKKIGYPADALVATETAQLIEVPSELVLGAMAESAKLSSSIACALHTKLVALHQEIDVLSAGDVQARLATLLLQLYERFGDDFDDGVSIVPVALSRRELAELVSTSFETAIRVMTRWEREGVVTTEDNGFAIKRMDALKAASGAPERRELGASATDS